MTSENLEFKTIYAIPVNDNYGIAWDKIGPLAQQVSSLFDESGHLKNCSFYRKTYEDVGKFIIFESSDRTVADDLNKALREYTELTILPMTTYQGTVKKTF
jgi:hypothetical protein